MPSYEEYAENKAGRDFLVGDLHGCRHLLDDKLAQVGFDPKVDRVFSVGDLIDRGPASLDTLRLIEEPWFHYVLGNHEEMLLTWLGMRPSSHHTAYDFLRNGGDWVFNLPPDQYAYLAELLAPKLLQAPYALHVNGQRPFNVIHADLRVGPASENDMLRDIDLLDDYLVQQCRVNLTWSRRLINEALKGLKEWPAATNGIMERGGEAPDGLSQTYVGHSILPHPLRYKNHFYLDTGAYQATLDKSNEAYSAK